MGKNASRMYRQLTLILIAFCLSVLWSLSISSIARAEDPDAICVVNVIAEGNV